MSRNVRKLGWALSYVVIQAMVACGGEGGSGGTNPQGVEGISQSKGMSLPAPTHLQAEAISATEVHLTWDLYPADAGALALEIEVWMGGKMVKKEESAINFTEMTVGSLLPGTSYIFRMRAYKNVPLTASKKMYSPYSNKAQATTFQIEGIPDPHFGIGGRVTTSFRNYSNAVAYAVELDHVGQVLSVAGSASDDEGEEDFAVAQYLVAGGIPNPAFGLGLGGTPGTVTTDFDGGHDRATAIVPALIDQGATTVAGYAQISGRYTFALARYRPTGWLDGDFGNDRDGLVTTPVGEGDARAYAAAAYRRGKIILAGSAIVGGKAAFALVRYNADGTLDTTFGDDDGNGGRTGMVLIHVAAGSNDVAKAVMIDFDLFEANDKILVAGYTNVLEAQGEPDTQSDFVVMRFDKEGTLDTTFGGNPTPGKVRPLVTMEDDILRGMVQHDGIVLTGYRDTAICAIRLDSDGTPDDEGYNFQVPFYPDALPHHAEALTSATQSDGKVLLAGFASRGGDPSNRKDIALMRVTADGAVDTEFGVQGRVTTDVGFGDAVAEDMVIQVDAKIVVAGFATNEWGEREFALVRYQ